MDQPITDRRVSLHDCRAEKMSFTGDVLSFIFPDGVWVTREHPENTSDSAVRTGQARVDISILDRDFDGVEIYLFRKNRKGQVIREEWEMDNFIRAVNEGAFQVEFITQYEGFQQVLYKGCVWFDKAPYHYECEIGLRTDKVSYSWDRLRYDRPW